MFRKYRVVNFNELVDEVFEKLTEFGESLGEYRLGKHTASYLVNNNIETDVASIIRDIIQGHEYYSETEKFDKGDIELVVKVSRDDFDAIEFNEDETMTIGVQLDFDLFYDHEWHDFTSDARYNFKVLIKGVK